MTRTYYPRRSKFWRRKVREYRARGWTKQEAKDAALRAWCYKQEVRGKQP